MSNVIYPQTAPNIRPSAFLSPPSSTVNPINRSFVITQNHTILFVAINKSFKTFDGLDHQYTPEEYLHQIDAHLIYTTGEQPLDPVSYNQRHKRKMAYIQRSLSGIAFS